jgi:hypothetical protein
MLPTIVSSLGLAFFNFMLALFAMIMLFLLAHTSSYLMTILRTKTMILNFKKTMILNKETRCHGGQALKRLGTPNLQGGSGEIKEKRRRARN